MAIALRQSTASQEVPLGPFLDVADGNTEETGITLSAAEIFIWKSGATALVAKNSGDATHMQNGIFVAVLDATDTDTLGPLVIFAKDALALWVKQECVVLAANIFDSGINPATDKLQVDVVEWLGTAVATPTVAGVPEVDTTHIAGSTTDVSTIPASVAAILVDTGTTLQAELDGIQADTEDIQTRIPAALVSGRIDASVGAIAANAITAAATAADFGTEVAAAVLAAAAVDPIDANVEQINTVAITGDGSGTPFGV